MKNNRSLSRLSALLVVAFGLLQSECCWASDVEVDGICYDLNHEAKTACVVADYLHEYSGSVILPSQVAFEGVPYTVNAIGDYAFFSSGIETISIPTSVTMIGEHAFPHVGSCKKLFLARVSFRLVTVHSCIAIASCRCPCLTV